MGRYIGHRGSAVLTIGLICIAFITSLFVWVEVTLLGCPASVDLFGTWFSVGTLDVRWSFNIDLLAAHMFLTVTGVSFAVHLYAIVYMRADPSLNLFLSYLSMFTGFMLVLVAADNLMLMLVGWEGIGVCSYLLISYYSHRLSAAKSATKAILVNRVSDGMLLWGILSIWWNLGSLEYDLIGFTNTQHTTWFLGLALLIGAMGKSAQILFHVWLADAMEGPTPVSALIHAATLVTAGVYLMVRTASLLSEIVVLIGALTALMAGVFATYADSDMKRVIAYSTCSQLGYMMVSVGLGELGAEASMGHLMTHASFKAALFLAAGMVISAAGGNKHMARYGSLSGAHTTVSTYMMLLVCSLSLMGWPETSGFYSKEVILNLVYNSVQPFADFAHTLLLLAAFITSLYSTKLFIQSFFLDYSGYNLNGVGVFTNKSFASNIIVLIAFSILLTDVVLKVWVGTNLLNCILTFTPWGVKTLPFGLVLAGIISAASLVGAQTTISNPISLVWVRFSGTRWGFDQIFARSLAYLVLDMGRITWYVGDKGLFSVNELK
jgi:proton-translocating NADH-quinone oxidoreductase chain L